MFFKITKRRTAGRESSSVTDDRSDQSFFDGFISTSALPPSFDGSHGQVQVLKSIKYGGLRNERVEQEQTNECRFESCIQFIDSGSVLKIAVYLMEWRCRRNYQICFQM